MRKFEYKAIPAPHQGTKAKGVKTTEDRFALSITDVLNETASDGWEYVRADTLPCDERKGLTGTQTTYQNLLIFRRPIAGTEPLALQPRADTVAMVDEDFDDGSIDVPHTQEVQSEPTPRPVSLDDDGTSSAPPLGSARGD